MPVMSREFGSMYYRDNGNHRDVVVLLHEYFGTGETWAAQRSYLARHFRVLTLDIRGHGRSPIGNGRITASDITADILALLDDLSIRAAHLVGCSLGAVASLDFARRFPSRALTVVAESVPIISDPEVQQYGQRYVTSIFPKIERSLDRIHGDAESGYARQILLKNFELDLEELPEDHTNATDRAGEIAAPVLIVAGDHDEVLNPDRALRLAKRLPHPSLALAPSAGHLIHREMPGLFNEVVLDHLLNAAGRGGT